MASRDLCRSFFLPPASSLAAEAMFALTRRFAELWMYGLDHDPLAGASPPRCMLRSAIN